MDSVFRIASRVASQQDEQYADQDQASDGLEQGATVEPEPGDGLVDETEYSAHIELSLSATFEGSVAKADLIKKIKQELKSSLEAGLQAISDDMGLTAVEAKVRPIRMSVAVVDDSLLGVDEFGMPEDGQAEHDMMEFDLEDGGEQDEEQDEEQDQ